MMKKLVEKRILTLSHLFGDGSFNRPSENSYSSPKSSVLHTDFFSIFFKGYFLSVYLYKNIIFSFTKRLGKSIFSFSFNPIMQSPIRNTRNLRPFGNRFSFSIMADKIVGAFIVLLFLISRPLAVFFAIIPIVVNSVNHCIFLSKLIYMNFIAFIHIIPKFLKGLPQYFYSTTTIMFIARDIFVRTSRFHYTENSPKSSMSHSVSFHKLFIRKGDTLSRMSPSLMLS